MALAIAALFLAPGHAQDDASVFDVADEAAVPAWRWQGDLLLQGDHVADLPGGREDLSRARLRLRPGLAWDGGGSVHAGGALRLSLGSDDNDESVANNDNARADAATLDALWLGWRGARTRLFAGKRALGLELTPMLWDADLRPVGAEAALDLASGFDRWSLAGGAWALDHPLGGDVRLQALQGGYHWREGAPVSVSVLLSLLDFGHLAGLAGDGLARGNRVQDGRHAEDFRLLDLQLALRRQSTLPLELRLDLVRNLAADRERDGIRVSAVLGDRFVPGQWEFGYAFQRIQRDAVLAAANADDWWFHAGARGHMPWAGRGFGAWSLRLALFLERRDGLSEGTERVLLDLERRW